MTAADSNHVWRRAYYLACKINAGVFAKAQGCKIIGVKEHNLCIFFFFTLAKTTKDAYKVPKATFKKVIKQSFPFKESMLRSQS
jgi:hypothetical protein